MMAKLEPVIAVWNEEYSKVGDTQEILTAEDDDAVVKFVAEEIKLANANLDFVLETMDKVQIVYHGGPRAPSSYQIQLEIECLTQGKVPVNWTSSEWQGPLTPIELIRVICGTIVQMVAISRDIQKLSQINMCHLLRPAEFLDALRVKAAGGIKDNYAECWFGFNAEELPEYTNQKLVSSFDRNLIKIEPESKDRVIVEISGITQERDANEEDDKASAPTKVNNFFIAWVTIDNEVPVGPPKGYWDKASIELVETPLYNRGNKEDELCKLRLLSEEGFSMSN